MKRKIFSLLFVLLFVVTLTSCGKSKSVEVKFGQLEVSMQVGETKDVKATYEVGKKVKDFALTYTVSDTTKATVDASGKVTAIAPGTVILTATGNDKNATSATVTIKISALPEYKVTFKADGATVGEVTYTQGATSITEPQVPAKAHYTGAWEAYSLNNANVTVNAVYTPVTYTVTFKADDQVVETVNYTMANPTVTAPAVPAKAHYEGAWEAYTLDGGNKVVNAVYTIITYTVTFDVQGGSAVASQTVNSGSAVEAPANPTKEGYIFSGWKLNGAVYDLTSPVTGDITLVAEWVEDVPETHTVTFMADDAVVNTVTFSEGDTSVTEPAVPAKAGYTGAWEAYTLGTEDITVNAVYTAIEYSVTFMANGDEVAVVKYTVENKNITEPAVPAKQHYENGAWAQYTLTTGDITVNATYTPIEYTITFKLDGTVLGTAKYTVESTVVLEPDIPAKEHYVGAYEAYSFVGGDLTVNATYSLREYVVTLNANGGFVDPEDLRFTIETLAQQTLPTPSMANATFLGWFEGGQKIEAIDEARDYNLKALWNRAEITVGEGQTYTTISAALAAAMEGDVINVLAGTYEEAVTISVSDITIKGPNAGVAGTATRADEAVIKGALTITGNNVTVDGIALEGAGNGIVLVDATNTVLTNLYSTGYNSNNSFITSDTLIKHLTITNSYIYVDDNVSGYTFRLNGMAGIVNVSNNTIIDTSDEYTMSFGDCSKATDMLIMNNIISGVNGGECTSIWIKTFTSTTGSLEIVGNTITKSAGTNLMLQNCTGNINVKYNTYIDSLVRISKAASYKGGPNAVYGYNVFENCTYTGEYQAWTDDALYPAGSTYETYTKEQLAADYAADTYYQQLGNKKVITVSYDTDGGNGIGSEILYAGSTITLPTPTKEGYSFLGWTLVYGSTDYLETLPTTITEDVTLYANWMKLAGYTVNFDFAGGVSDELYLKNATEVNHYAVDNYNYNGGAYWTGANYADFVFIGTSGSDPKATFSDRIYIGKDSVSGYWVILDIVTAGSSPSWPAGAQYLITVSNSYSANTAVKKIANTLSVGNIVAFEGDVTTATKNSPVNVRFYDKDATIDSYEMTKYITTSEKLPAPTKLGYTFDGWYDANNTKHTQVSTLKDGMTLTAKWIELTPVTDITINTLPEDLEDNATFQIVATVVPTDAFFQQIIYSSSNTDVLKVSEAGLITAVNPGTATITVRDYMSKKVLTYTIRVYSTPSIDVAFTTDFDGVLAVDETVALTASTYGKDINANDVVYTYVSSNENVATVDANGVITAVALGNATITVSNNVTPEHSVQVGIVVNNLSVETKIDEVIKLLVEANNSVVEYGNISLYDDGDVIYYDSQYGSVNDYLFSPYAVNTDYTATAEANSNGHKSRRDVDTIEFVTVHDTATLTGTVVSIASGMASGGTSIHYTVGNDAIYAVVPEKYIAYHAGDGTSGTFSWQPTGVMAPANNAAPVTTIEKTGDTWYYVINGQKSNLVAPISGTKNGVAMTIQNPGNHNLSNTGPAWEIINGEYHFAPSWVCFTQVAAGAIGSFGGNNNSIGIEMCVNTSGDIYDTWQRTAQLVADICIRNNLGLHRVLQHNTWTGKNCPQSIIFSDYWDRFLEMVELNYILMKDYSDVEITMTSNNPTIVDNTGRVIAAPTKTTTVSYDVTVTVDGTSKTITLYSVIPGTTIWEQWDGNRPADLIWNEDGKFGKKH